MKPSRRAVKKTMHQDAVPRNLRVGLLTSHQGLGGPSSVISALCRELPTYFISPVLISLYCTPGHVAGEATSEGTVCLHLKRGLVHFPEARRRLARVVEEMAIDLVHSHGLLPDLLNIMNFRVPSVSTVHNVQTEDYPNTYGLVAGWVLVMAHRLIHSRIDSLVACSYTVRSATPKILRRHTTVIYNGVTREGADRVGGNKLVLDGTLERLGPDSRVFLAVCALVRAKGIKELCVGFSAGRRPGEHLFVVGDGPLRGELSQERYDGVHLVGSSEAVAGYLQRANHFVSNSRSEGFPISVLEACSQGVVPYLSDIAAHRELAMTLTDVEVFTVDDIEGMLELSRANSQIGSADRLMSEQNYFFGSQKMASEYAGVYMHSIWELA